MFDDAALALEEIEPKDKTRNSSTELSGTPDREHSGARAQKLELVRIRDLLVEMTQLCASACAIWSNARLPSLSFCRPATNRAYFSTLPARMKAFPFRR